MLEELDFGVIHGIVMNQFHRTNLYVLSFHLGLN